MEISIFLIFHGLGVVAYMGLLFIRLFYSYDLTKHVFKNQNFSDGYIAERILDDMLGDIFPLAIMFVAALIAPGFVIGFFVAYVGLVILDKIGRTILPTIIKWIRA